MGFDYRSSVLGVDSFPGILTTQKIPNDISHSLRSGRSGKVQIFSHKNSSFCFRKLSPWVSKMLIHMVYEQHETAWNSMKQHDNDPRTLGQATEHSSHSMQKLLKLAGFSSWFCCISGAYGAPTQKSYGHTDQCWMDEGSGICSVTTWDGIITWLVACVWRYRMVMCRWTQWCCRTSLAAEYPCGPTVAAENGQQWLMQRTMVPTMPKHWTHWTWNEHGTHNAIVYHHFSQARPTTIQHAEQLEMKMGRLGQSTSSKVLS